MRLLNLIFFSTIVLLGVAATAAPQSVNEPQRIELSPAKVQLDPDDFDDLIVKKRRFDLRYGLGVWQGALIEANQNPTIPYLEFRFGLRTSSSSTEFATFKLATDPQILMIDLGKQWSLWEESDLETYYKFSVSPVLAPNEGIATLTNIRRLQCRAAFGADNLITNIVKVGTEFAVGYSLNGLSLDLTITFRWPNSNLSLPFLKKDQPPL